MNFEYSKVELQNFKPKSEINICEVLWRSLSAEKVNLVKEEI